MAFTAVTAITGDTTLNGAISSTTTQTVTVANGGGAILTTALGGINPNPGSVFMIAIDDEVMRVDNISTDTVTVTRGFLGTTAATHSNSAPVHALTVASLWKALKAGILATAPGS